MKNKVSKVCLMCLLGIFVVSCNFAPKLEVPKVKLPSNSSFVPATNGTFKINWGWWKEFKNPQLNKLIELALKNNEDLLIATARLEQVMALAGLKKAQLFPLLGYKAQVSRTKIPESIENNIENFGMALRMPVDIENPNTSYNILTSASYELDFWGKLRNARKSALAKVLAVKAMQDTVKISLVTNVATIYFNLLSLQTQIEKAKELKDRLEEIYKYRKQQFEYGMINKIAVHQAKAQYEEVKSLIEDLKKAESDLKITLAFLIGQSPKELFEKELVVKGALPDKLQIPAMLPSEVLLKRPDILMAEEELKAANFDIGVAKAQYFPSIKLTGYLGSLSSEFDELMKSSSIFWSVGAGITGPIFDFGRIKSQVEYSKAKKKEALLNYVKTVKTAFKEVYSALVAISYTEKKLKIEKSKLQAIKEELNLVKKQYENGLTNRLNVLLLESNYLKEELKLIKLKAELVNNYIFLYKALGGGIVI